MRRESRQEIKSKRDTCSKIMLGFDDPQKVFLGAVNIVCNEPISGNRIMVSKTANYMAADSGWYSKYSIPFSHACNLIAAVIPQFQQELAEQKQQRIYSNDYKIHLKRLVDDLIIKSKEKAKTDKANMSSIERLASATDIKSLTDLDFITVRFTNANITSRESEDTSER